jgi:hypothetical protein
MAAVRDAQNASSILRNRLRSVSSCVSSHFDNGSLTFELDTMPPLPTYYAMVRFASKRRHSTSATEMSALGQKRTFALQNGMSALPLTADMCSATRPVRYVPKADIARRHTAPAIKTPCTLLPLQVGQETRLKVVLKIGPAKKQLERP